MIGGFPIEAGSKVFHPQDVDQERGKFEDPPAKIAHFIMKRGVIEKRRIVIADETNATGAGRNDVIGARKVLQEFGTDIAGFVPEPGIVGRLAAAGLTGIVLY